MWILAVEVVVVVDVAVVVIMFGVERLAVVGGIVGWVGAVGSWVWR